MDRRKAAQEPELSKEQKWRPSTHAEYLSSPASAYQFYSGIAGVTFDRYSSIGTQEVLTKDKTGEAGHVRSSKTQAYYLRTTQTTTLPTKMAALGEDLLGVVNKLQDLVFNTIGNDSLDLPQIVCLRPQAFYKIPSID